VIRLHELCQNPDCKGADSASPKQLDLVSPPLRVDAKFCSTRCKNDVGAARRAGMSRPDAAAGFWERWRALRGRPTVTTRALRERHRAVL
jgi:hypothetical protein